MHTWTAPRPLLDRKARGAWATPHWLVEHLLDVVLDPVLATRTTAAGLHVLDPACGDGRFLAAAAARIARRFGASSGRDGAALVGIELDAATAAEARRRLGPAATVLLGDALRMSHRERFDVVVGNPPFLNQLASATTRRGRSEHGGGPYADAAVEFLALALRLARPDGGRVGLVLPQSLLATRDAADVRRAALVLGRLDGLWWSAGDTVFDAQVHTVAAAFVLGERQRSVRRWRGQPCHELAPGRRHRARPTADVVAPAGRRRRDPRRRGPDRRRARRLGHRHRRLPRPVLRPDPVRRRRAGRRRPSSRPGCSTRAARRGGSVRPASGVAATSARASTWPPSARRRPRLAALDRGSPGAQGAAGHPDRRPGGGGRRAGHLDAERARGVGGAPHRGRPLADRRRALLAGGLGLGRRHLPRRGARARRPSS